MIQSDILSTMIAQLRPKFISALAERLALFQAIRGALGGPLQTREMMADLRMGLHKSAGLAATMGFDEVGALSRELELVIVERGEGAATRPLPRGAVERFDRLLAAMTRAVEETRAGA